MNKEPKSWEETMTPAEVAWLWSELRELVKDPCQDNYRAARTWISSQRRRYRKQRDLGCCGFIDIIVRNPRPIEKGKDLYMIGCNYGH